MVGRTTAFWPGRTFVTFFPTSSTVPPNSCPIVTGLSSPVIGCGLSGIRTGPERYSCTSGVKSAFVLPKEILSTKVLKQGKLPCSADASVRRAQLNLAITAGRLVDLVDADIFGPMETDGTHLGCCSSWHQHSVHDT